MLSSIEAAILHKITALAQVGAQVNERFVDQPCGGYARWESRFGRHASGKNAIDIHSEIVDEHQIVVMLPTNHLLAPAEALNLSDCLKRRMSPSAIKRRRRCAPRSTLGPIDHCGADASP
jgi:hypothetical protein